MEAAKSAATARLVTTLAAQGDLDDITEERRAALNAAFAELTGTADAIRRLRVAGAGAQQLALQRAIHRAAAAFVIKHKFPFNTAEVD